MTVNDLVENFTINPNKDIAPSFKLSKKIDLDASKHNGCYNCGDTSNQTNLKSSSWTSVQHCRKCKHLNVVHHQDRMGGSYTDVIECYTEK